jgi:GH25 family lysozyme M1 (1,4-beta-N-acetylmuramidase)
MKGVDISDAQGKKSVAQFRALKAAGYGYVIVKTGEGGGTVAEARSFAEDAEHNIACARAAGLEIGVYHFVHPRTTRKGREEAKVALAAARQAGWNPRKDKRFAIDFEVTNGLDDVALRRYALSFIRYIRRHTRLRRPWFYTFTSFWNGHGFDRPMGCRIWQADFTKSLKRPPGIMRGLPRFGSPRSPIKRWQWTSEGRLAAFHVGNLDLNTGPR